MMGQEGLGHRVMPSPPGAGFIVIHPQLAFGLFQGTLDGPAPPTDSDQLRARTAFGRIAQIGFDFSVRLSAAPQHQPQASGGATPSGPGDAQEDELGHDRPLAALFNRVALPSTGRQASRHLTNLFGPGIPLDQTGMLTGAAHRAWA